jgi:hypothetical protein
MSQPCERGRLLARADAILCSSAGLITFALYTRTLAPWVLPGDSGEFQVLAYQVGTAHTTGYPVYLLLGKLFLSLVPLRDVAYRVNLFSAFMAALTVAGVYLAAQLMTRNRWAAMLAAFGLALGFTFWSQALIAEVYSTGSVFLVMVCVGLLAWYRGAPRWTLFLAGLFGGLGLGVHGSVPLFAPAVILFLLLNAGRQRQPVPGLHGAAADGDDTLPCTVPADPPGGAWQGTWRPALSGALVGAALYLIAFAAVDLHAPPANIFNAAYGPARSQWDLSAADLQNPSSLSVVI